MNPADMALVQKHLGATLAKVAAMRQGLVKAKNTLKQQEQALYAATQTENTAAVAPVSLPTTKKSASILDGDVDMTAINNAIQRLNKGCDCPNIQSPNLLPKPEGT